MDRSTTWTGYLDWTIQVHKRLGVQVATPAINMGEHLASTYLSVSLRRRLRAGPINPPERTRFSAALAFIDISGFTALSEALAQAHGAEGAELLQSYTNIYLERLISAVHAFGGDILKFGGDAFIVLWRHLVDAEDTPIEHLIEQACACCLAILSEFDFFEVNRLRGKEDGATPALHLRLHAGIAAGEVSEFILGKASSAGGQGLETLVAGPVVARLGAAVDAAASGELCLSAAPGSPHAAQAALTTAADALCVGLQSHLLPDGAIRISHVRRREKSAVESAGGVGGAASVAPDGAWLASHPYVVQLREAREAQERRLEREGVALDHGATSWREFLPAVLRRQLPEERGEVGSGTTWEGTV